MLQCLVLLQNVFSYDRMCSLTTECVLQGCSSVLSRCAGEHEKLNFNFKTSVISGREARFPYLDENVVAFISGLSLETIAGMPKP